MAAYAALVSAAQTIEEAIQLLHHDDRHYPPLSFQEKEETFRSIYDGLISLQSFLELFPEKAQNLEVRIRDVSFQAEDIIEDVHFTHHQRGSDDKQRHSFQELQMIAKEINSIHEEVSKIESAVEIEDRLQLMDYSPAASSSSNIAPASKESLVGFQDDLMEMKARLCGESSKREVIPIFGMGGIGKTTLARSAYNDPLIVEHFHIRAWLTISQNYTAIEIFQSLLDSIKASGLEPSKACAGGPEEHVYKSLKGRKYLIIMDDVWSTEAWDVVKMIFPDDNNGSRVILTTRLEDVAAYIDPGCRIHNMNFLNEDSSWGLLRAKVFQNEECPLELYYTGKMIAKCCGGLPLALVVVSGLLSSVSRTQDSWKNVADNVNEIVASANEDQLNRILSLSYTNLPHHLRPCFLYLAGFPEDYKIQVSELIKLWVAEGFLKPSGSKTLEENAEECLEHLGRRSMILVDTKKSNGQIKSCSMHDLMRDMCIRKAQEEKFFLQAMKRSLAIDDSLPTRRRIQRRISVCPSGEEFSENMYSSSIRSILYFHDGLFPLEGFRRLRILNALAVTFREFPSVMVELIRLRYLAFGLTEICSYECLPEDIEKLEKLQTLVVYPKVVLPFSILRMRQLKHIISKSITLPKLPSPDPGHNISIENLHTLWGVRTGYYNGLRIHLFPNVKKLKCYFHDSFIIERFMKELVHLHQLENLKLIDASIFQKPMFYLSFPTTLTTLKKLSLHDCKIPWRRMSVIGSLPNLEVLKIKKTKDFPVGNVWETNEREFPRLKVLEITDKDLEIWKTESDHFPCLERLYISGCESLTAVPESIGEIPTLELIEVNQCYQSVGESAKKIQEEQEDMGNETLQVRIHYTLTKPWKSRTLRFRTTRPGRYGTIRGRYGTSRRRYGTSQSYYNRILGDLCDSGRRYGARQSYYRILGYLYDSGLFNIRMRSFTYGWQMS